MAKKTHKTTPRKEPAATGSHRHHRARSAARVAGEHHLPEAPGLGASPPVPMAEPRPMIRPTPAPPVREVDRIPARPESLQGDGRLLARPTVMLILDLLTSTWSLARTLMGAPLRLIQATRERVE